MKSTLSKSDTVAKTSDIYGFLAAVLNNRPDESMVHSIRKYFQNKNEVISGMQEFLQERAVLYLHRERLELAAEWTRLFRGLSPQLGPPPPYTGIFFSHDGTGIEALRSIQRMYNEEGVTIGNRRDRADYLGFELEFMTHLSNRAAKALKNNALEKADKYNEKLELFTKLFVSPWISEYVDKALPFAKTSYFREYLMMLNECMVR